MMPYDCCHRHAVQGGQAHSGFCYIAHLCILFSLFALGTWLFGGRLW